jgi:thioesterase domain-containing protein
MPSIGWTPLVPIQPHGARPPLFLVHAAGGNILTYRSLAHYLGPDQPVYGLQAQGLDGKQPLLEHVEEMAALYIHSIQTLQPAGPYLLGGYCMGGTVALEMAQQLQRQGEEVAFLALFETYNWHNMKLSTLPEITVATLQKLEFHLRNFLLLSATGKRTFLNEKLKVAQSRRKIWSGRLRARLGRLGGRYAIADLLSAKVWDHNDRVSLEYKPTSYAGTITHFRPLKEYACHSGPDLRWEQLAAHVETHRVEAYPAGMMVEPFVVDLAAQVNNCIVRALAPRAPRLQPAAQAQNGSSEPDPVAVT